MPFAAGDGAMAARGDPPGRRADAALGAEVLLALAPIQAHAVRRTVAYQLTVNDAGTWRVALTDMQAAIEPGASDAKVAFRVSGTPGRAGGAVRRRRPAQAAGAPRGRPHGALARCRAPAPGADARPGGRGGRRLLAAGGPRAAHAVAPEDGRGGIIAFDDGDSPITAVATRRGAIVLRSGIEQPQATLHGPEQELVALLAGLAPGTPIRVSGDIAQASAFVTRLHRGQGLV